MGKRKNEQDCDYNHMLKKFRKLRKHLFGDQERERTRPPPPPPPPLPPSPPPARRRRLTSSSSSSSARARSRSSSSSSTCSRSSCSQRSSSSPPPPPQGEGEQSESDESQPRGRGAVVPRVPSQNEDAPPNRDAQRPPNRAAGVVAPPSGRQPPPPPGAQQPPPGAQQPPPGPQQPPHTADQPVTTPQLDDELLKILGDDPSKKKVTGKDIQSDLAIRLQHIATSGLSKETRKELLDKYLPPGNCTLIDAPDLNPEVKAAISETIYKRDKGIKSRQKQIASATTCVSEALTILLSSEPRNMELIKLLMDASKLLCDSQNQDSATRRNFVLYNLKKELKDQLQETKIDKFLFSQELADTLKAAKAISKSGADMKAANPHQNQANKKAKPPQKNWRAPPPTNRPKGMTRTKEPARKPRPETSSKQSSRQQAAPPPPTSHRSRR